MNNEQIKKIINDAPEGATHIDADKMYWHNSSAGYWLICEDGSTTANAIIGNNCRSLADLLEVLSLRTKNKMMGSENAELRKVKTELTQWVTAISNGHGQVPDWIKQSAKSLLASLAEKE